MEGIEHKIISVNGLNIHIAEKGKVPLVLFLHGFPQLWYSWRHQITFMASHGYRAVAPDLRGYGDTTGAPIDDATKFSVLHVVGDMVALLDAITPEQEDKKVFVVGHDWGAHIGWHLCLFRPDKVKAVVNLSVQFLPRNPLGKVVEYFRAAYGEDHYIVRFQEPGDMEAEIASMGTKTFLKKFMSFRKQTPFYFPKGKGFGDDNAPVILPSWLSEEDVDYYASKFDKTGFTGGINYYRAFDLSWELTAAWTGGAGSQVNVPAKFVVGDQDLVYHTPGTKDYIHNGGFHKFVPLLEEIVVIEGAAHFINEEIPDEINKHIYDFLHKF